MGSIGIFRDEVKKKWVQFDADTEVHLGFLNKDGIRDLLEKAKKISRKTGANIDNVFDLLLGRQCVFGWRKIKEHDHPGLIVENKPFPFTPENRDLLIKYNTRFSRFVNETVTDDTEAMADDDMALDFLSDEDLEKLAEEDDDTKNA